MRETPPRRNYYLRHTLNRTLMALVVTFEPRTPTTPAGIPASKTFHVDDLAGNVFLLRQFMPVLSIRADGQEHEYILRHFQNLPSRHDSTVWRGDWAAFIAENLP